MVDEYAKWVGLDEAIIGVAERCGSEPALVYDRGLVAEILVARGVNREDVEEYIDFNIASAWIGESTPYLMTYEDPVKQN